MFAPWRGVHQKENHMRFVQYGVLARTVGTAGAFVVLLAQTLGAVRAADDKIYVMK
jgi:hypothetical protein